MKEKAGVQVLNAQDVADLLGVHLRTSRDMLSSGTIPARKVGRRWLTTPEAVKNYLEGGHQSTRKAECP